MKMVDTGGSEQFTAMRDLYIKNGDGIIVIYSVSSHGTFSGIDEIKGHVLRIKDCDDFPIILVGGCTNRDKKHREVTTEQGQEMAKKLECPFFEVHVNDGDQVDAVVKALLPLIFTWREEMNKQKKEKDRDCVVM